MSDSQKPFLEIDALPGMVRWFRPLLLLRIARRAFISAIFGEYADQRIVQSAVDDVNPDELVARYDYADEDLADNAGAIWIDYVADIGDGFDPTFAIASLMSPEQLDVEGTDTLSGGKLLIMGGDEVYPFASRDEYERRTFQAYRRAYPSDDAQRRVFAIPGNHDWYDGLVAFDYHFCKAREGFTDRLHLGGWVCPQHRSYFAVKLPNNWWIWGADIQLNQYLDTGQVHYFRRVSERMGPDDKIILCMPQPSWLYAKRMGAEWSYRNLGRISEIAHKADAKIAVVLAGDVHHYSRYYSSDQDLHLITSGGGGAYLHPTHQLRDEVDVSWKGNSHKFTLKSETDGENIKTDTSIRACYPSKSESNGLAWRSLGFLFRNLSFCFTLGLIYWLFTYLFRNTIAVCISGAGGSNRSTLTGAEQLYLKCPDGYYLGVEWLLRFIGDDLLNNPLFLVCIVGSLVILIFYVDSKRLFTRFIVGSLHWLAHMTALFGGYVGVNLLNMEVYKRLTAGSGSDTYLDTFWHYLAFPIEMILIGTIVGGMIWGIYFFLTCRFGRMHWDHAFSSMRIMDYKNFLRLKIEPDKLTIYPVGLQRVPRRQSWRQTTVQQREQGVIPGLMPQTPMKPKLIEKPIVIRL